MRDAAFEVTGWGTTSEGGKSSHALIIVSVPYVEQDVCNNSYGGAIKGSMLCAGKKGSDSCQGDSGGPLVLKSANGPVGVVSFGEGCGRENKYGVYTRVSSYQRWIQDNTAPAKSTGLRGREMPVPSSKHRQLTINRPGVDGRFARLVRV